MSVASVVDLLFFSPRKLTLLEVKKLVQGLYDQAYEDGYHARVKELEQPAAEYQDPTEAIRERLTEKARQLTERKEFDHDAQKRFEDNYYDGL